MSFALLCKGRTTLIHNIAFILQIITTLLLVVLMAIQTDKAEQGGGGVMGLGAAGGRTSGSINLPVGAERILKPLTVWTAVGFLFSSVLNATKDLQWWHFLAAVAVYLLVMLFGGRLWKIVTGAAGR
jgi:preprotein translocase subunit SecG